MKRSITCLVFILSFSLSLQRVPFGMPFGSLSLFNSEEDPSVFESLQIAFSNLLELMFSEDQNLVRSECRKHIEEAYVNTTKSNNFVYLLKLFSDSSKNDNDVSTYSECMRKKYGSVSNLAMTYLVVIVRANSTKTSEFEFKNEVSNLFGMCVVKGCNEDEYKRMLTVLNLKLKQVMPLEDKNLRILSLSEDDANSTLSPSVVLNFIPFILLILFFLCVLFNGIPFHLFRLCYKEKGIKAKKTSVSEHSGEIVSFPNQKLYLLTESFNITENGEELYKSKAQQGEMHNDMGLTYIKGIRGLSMLLLVFGFFFFDLHNSPVSVKGKKSFANFLSSFAFSIFFFGLRFSPKILFSCSGYCLFYKFISYLDEKSDQSLEKQKEKAKGETDDNQSPEDMLNVSLGQQLEAASSESSIKALNDVPYSLLGFFYLYQLHKYLMFIMMIIFMKYSLYYIPILFNKIGPMWVYFNRYILQDSDEERIFEIFKTIFLAKGFMMYSIQSRSFLNYFWIAENEISFFIITSSIIFLGYKFHFRSDRIFFFSIIALLIAKVAYYISYAFQNDTLMNAALYLYYLDYGKFSISPYYNIVYYFLGAYFSIINYSIQKGMTYDEADRQLKPFLLVSVRYANLFKKQSKKTLYVIGIIGFMVLFFFSFFQPIVLAIMASSEKTVAETLNAFMSSYWIKVYYLLDGDLIVLLIHGIGLACYVKGDNLMNSFLSSSFWSMYNQFYFSFILLLNPLILYILYQSETRITFDFWNCIFYSLICHFLIILVGSFAYICFEAPLRRVLRHILHFKQERDEEVDYVASSNDQSTASIKED